MAGKVKVILLKRGLNKGYKGISTKMSEEIKIRKVTK